MKFEEKAILLTAESKPYDFNGNSGVSHSIRLNINGEIYPCKSNEAQVKELKKFEGTEGTAIIEVVSRKEAITLRLSSFEA